MRILKTICYIFCLVFISVAHADERLINAVYNNDVKKTRDLLWEGVNINAQDKKYGYTALIWAVHNEQQKIAKALLSAGADPNIRGFDGNTALLWAIHKQNIPLLKMLIKAKAYTNVKDKKGLSPLIWAMYKNNTEIFNILASSGANVNIVDQDGHTPLEWAMNDKNLTVVKILVIAGADLNKKNKNGVPPLVLMIGNGNTDIAKILIAGKADVNSSTDTGITALHMAIDRNNTPVIRWLLKMGADPNIVTPNGMHPLMYAVQRNNHTAVATLIEAGSDVHYVNKFGINAINLATRYNYTPIIDTLQSAGAKIATHLGNPKYIRGVFLYRERGETLPPESLIRIFDGYNQLTLLHEFTHLYFKQYELLEHTHPFYAEQLQKIYTFAGAKDKFLTWEMHELLTKHLLAWFIQKNPFDVPFVDQIPPTIAAPYKNVRIPPIMVQVFQNMFANTTAFNPTLKADINAHISPIVTGAERTYNTRVMMAFLYTHAQTLGISPTTYWQQINLRIVREKKFTEKLPLTADEIKTLPKSQ